MSKCVVCCLLWLSFAVVSAVELLVYGCFCKRTLGSSEELDVWMQFNAA